MSDRHTPGHDEQRLKLAKEGTQVEGYPPGWLHATIHLNPQTGELHSDGDHSVRTWLEERLPALPRRSRLQVADSPAPEAAGPSSRSGAEAIDESPSGPSVRDVSGEGERTCGHRSPLNYDRSRWATCELAAGHEGDHRQGNLAWADRHMPSRVSGEGDG